MSHFAQTCCLILGLVASNIAGAGQITGCLTPGGKLINIAPGENPANPCGPQSSQVELGLIEETTCPCDFSAATEWAGWHLPVCKGEGSADTFYALWVEDVSSEQSDNCTFDPCGLDPIMYVSNVDGCVTATTGGSTLIDREAVLDAEELEACLEELNKAALKLGLAHGCTLDILD